MAEPLNLAVLFQHLRNFSQTRLNIPCFANRCYSNKVIQAMIT